MNPKISVIMSVYNGEQFLKESLESILGQSFTDFEFIIIDDCSNDKTPEILKAYSFRDPRIKIISNKENLGLTKSLNEGAKEARGEYVARMDSGDTSEKERFEKQVKFLNDNSDFIVVGAWAYFIDEDGARVGEMKTQTKDINIRKYLIRHNQFVHSSIMVRKNVLEKAGLYNEEWRYAQDYELYFRLLPLGKMANIPEYLVSYRLSPNSITRSKNKKQIMFSVRARAQAIKDKKYGIFNYVFLILPTIGAYVSYGFKEKIKKILR